MPEIIASVVDGETMADLLNRIGQMCSVCDKVDLAMTEDGTKAAKKVATQELISAIFQVRQSWGRFMAKTMENSAPVDEGELN